MEGTNQDHQIKQNSAEKYPHSFAYLSKLHEAGIGRLARSDFAYEQLIAMIWRIYDKTQDDKYVEIVDEFQAIQK